MRHLRFLVAVGLVLAALPSFASEKHPFDAKDLWSMERIEDPQSSPDGLRVAFVLRKTDFEANKSQRDIYVIDLKGGEPQQWTSDSASDVNPRWSPDGRMLYFLSSRSGSSQIWKMPATGGEAEQVSDLPLDVANLEISPDGKLFVFSLEVFVGCDELACTAERLRSEEDRVSSGMIYDRVFVRHWDTWKDGRRSHLFAMSTSGGMARDLTGGMDGDIPSKPWGGSEEWAFSPDSSEIIFGARLAGNAEPWSTNFDLFQVPFDGSRPARRITENPAWDTQPVFSPGGKTLVYLSMQRPGYEADRFRIVLKFWPEGPERMLAADWDRSPSSMFFGPDGQKLFVTAQDVGHKKLFSIDLASGEVEELVGDGYVSGAQLAGTDRILYGLDHFRSPVELFSISLAGGEPSRLTRVNDERLASISMGEARQFSFSGWNGETVHGWVVEPADFDAGKRYPLAFLIHGGPQGSFGNHFHYRWNPQTYAGAGYGSVIVDFHGSTGYGQAFTDSIRGDWGGKPLEDLRKGLAYALEKNEWLDGDQVCALGASYGGYMINWIAGQWPDRFRCLVNHDGNLDERMAYFNTEELWFPEWDHEGTPWTNPESFEKHNPVRFVDRWKTPMLVVHGALDYRVVDTQGIATFNALQRRGIPSRFLYFPDENHWVLSPANGLLWHDTVLSWLDRWAMRKE